MGRHARAAGCSPPAAPHPAVPRSATRPAHACCRISDLALQRAAQACCIRAAQHSVYVWACGCSVCTGGAPPFHIDESPRRMLTWQCASPGAQYMWGRPISGVQTPQVLLQHAMAASAPRGAAPPPPRCRQASLCCVRDLREHLGGHLRPHWRRRPEHGRQAGAP